MLRKFLLLSFFFLFIFINNKSISEEFNFEGEEIEILNNGEKLKSNKGVKITSSNGMIITAQEFEYDKNNSELFVEKNVLVNDVINNTIIKTNKIKYIKKLEQIFTSEDTEIEIEKKVFIKTKNLVYFRKNQEIKSIHKTEVKDNFGNNLITEGFLYDIQNKILKGKNATVKDVDGNNSFFKSFFSKIIENEIYGKDIKINFSNKSFQNIKNEPRLYGNTMQSKDNNTIISKGIFFFFKKRDGCPPWTLKANKIIHDKE